jgi:YHS domain-containing protein
MAMADIENLAKRVDAKFTATLKKWKQFQTQEVREYQERQKRLEIFGSALQQTRDIWAPRLEMLARRFGDHVTVTPKRLPSRRERTLDFDSPVARVRLQFAASTNRDVRRLIVECNVEIIPVLIEFQPHLQIEFPLDAIDFAAVTQFIDDRIVEFVRTYLAIHEDTNYLQDQMVEDPIAGVRFPKFAAGAATEWNGKTWYFLGEETRREFEQQHNLLPK